MSKNHDRYKEDLSQIDIERLDDIEIESFERFRPKQKKKVEKKSSGKDREEEQ